MKKRLLLVICSLAFVFAVVLANNNEDEGYTQYNFERIQVEDHHVVITNQEELVDYAEKNDIPLSLSGKKLYKIESSHHSE